MKSVEELACFYVAILRAAFLVHQNSHWTCKGSNFYGSHLLFERLYNNSTKDADAAAEKMIGVFGENTLNLDMQAQLIGKMLLKYSTSTPFENSLKVEKDVLEFSDKFYKDLKEEGKLSLGVDDFIMATASNREEAVYLLQQSMKQGKNMNDKQAKRKALFEQVKSASAEDDYAKNIQQKLMLWFSATVPSYVQGKCDMSILVDVAHKKIFGSATISKVISPDMQQKIEEGFKNYANKLLGADYPQWMIETKFVMPPVKQ